MKRNKRLKTKTGLCRGTILALGGGTRDGGPGGANKWAELRGNCLGTKPYGVGKPLGGVGVYWWTGVKWGKRVHPRTNPKKIMALKKE